MTAARSTVVSGCTLIEPPYGIRIADGPAWLFVRPHDLEVEPTGRAQGMPAVLTSVVTTGPTYRLQLTLEQADAEVEAEMAKIRFDALGLAPGASVRLRPLEFGLVPADGAASAMVVPTARTGFHRRQAAVA